MRSGGSRFKFQNVCSAKILFGVLRGFARWKTGEVPFWRIDNPHARTMHMVRVVDSDGQ